MIAIAVIVVWAIALGFSPGLALIAVALATLAFDRYGREFLR